MRRISAFDIWNGMKIYLNISLRVKNVQSWEFDWKKLKWRRFILISNIHESGRQQRQHSNILDNHLAVAHWTLLFCFPSLFWTSTNLFRNSKLCRRTDFVLLFILFWIFICCWYLQSSIWTKFYFSFYRIEWMFNNVERHKQHKGVWITRISVTKCAEHLFDSFVVLLFDPICVCDVRECIYVGRVCVCFCLFYECLSRQCYFFSAVLSHFVSRKKQHAEYEKRFHSERAAGCRSHHHYKYTTIRSVRHQAFHIFLIIIQSFRNFFWTNLNFPCFFSLFDDELWGSRWVQNMITYVEWPSRCQLQ